MIPLPFYDNSFPSGINQIKTLSRVSMSAFFGLSVLLFGYTLALRTRKVPLADRVLFFAKFFFLNGAFATVSYGTLEIVFPFGPMSTQVYTSVCFFLAVVVLCFEFGKNALTSFSFLASAFAFLLTTVAPFLEAKPLGHNLFSNKIIFFHIVASVIGEALFIVSFLTSLIYLNNYKKLKQKKINKELNPKSLSHLEKMIELFSLIGLTFITFALISGIVLVLGKTHTQENGYIKILWSFLVWGWYIITLFGRHSWGWSGRRCAHLTIFGMFLIFIGLFGTIWQ